MEFTVMYKKQNKAIKKKMTFYEIKYPFHDDKLLEYCGCEEDKLLFCKVMDRGVIRVIYEERVSIRSTVLEHLFICRCRLKHLKYYNTNNVFNNH